MRYFLVLVGLSSILLSVGCGANKPQPEVQGSSRRSTSATETQRNTTEPVSEALILMSNSIAPIRFADGYPTRIPISAANANAVSELVTVGKGALREVFWSHDGETLVAVGTIGLYVFDAANWERAPRVFANVKPPFAISRDGSALAGRTSETALALWDTKTGKVLAIPDLATDPPITSVAFSPTGDELAAIDAVGQLYRWVINDEYQVNEPDLSTQLPTSSTLFFRPDGSLFAVRISEREVDVFNADNGATVLTYQTPDWYRWFEVSSNGEMIVLPVADEVNFDGRQIAGYQLFDTDSGVDIGEIPAENFFTTVNAADRTYLSINQGTLELHDIQTQTLVEQFSFNRILRTLDNQATNLDTRLPYIPLSSRHLDLLSAEFSPDGDKIALAYESGELVLIDLATGNAAGILGAFSTPFYDAWLTPDGESLVAGTEHSVDIWDLTTGRGRFGVPRESGSGLTLHPAGNVFAVGEAGIMLYDVHSLIADRPLRSSGRADVIAFDRTGTYLAWMTDRGGSPRLHIRNTVELDMPIVRIPLEAGQGFVPMMAFSPTGETIAAIHGNGNLSVWDIATLRPLVQIPLPDTNYHRIAYSSDGRTLAYSAGSLPIREIDIPSATETILVDTGYFALSMAYNLDGTVLAVGGIDSIVLLDAVSGDTLATLDGLSAYVENLRFSNDGAVLISASSDGTARLWGIHQD